MSIVGRNCSKCNRMCIATTHTFFISKKNRVGATPTLSDYVLLHISLSIAFVAVVVLVVV